MQKHTAFPGKLHGFLPLVATLVLAGVSTSGALLSAYSPMPGPKPAALAEITVAGELGKRLERNFDRLEEEKYRPDKVFLTLAQSRNWPGDTEGRTVLGLTLDAQATHRTPKYLDEILRRFPEHMNERGYFGNIEPAGVADEQQLSSHGWVLRGLCEHYLWKHDAADLAAINRILDDLALPTRGLHREYPVAPAERESGGGIIGATSKRIGAWNVSTDVGCDFIFLDGLVQAYQVTGRADLKPLIDEMIARFLTMDLLAIKAQTHSSLTGMRALLRYYETTGDQKLLRAVEKRFAIYRRRGMTENYENYNWFDRPEWTESCAVIDSYMVAMGLWRWTRQPGYIELAEHIYYNAMAFQQRANGGFGTDFCSGAGRPDVAVQNQEAYWCCTMRGGEGLSRVAESLFFTDRDGVYVIHFNDARAALTVDAKGSLRLREETGYPFVEGVKITVTEADLASKIALRFFAPWWLTNSIVTVNSQSVRCRRERGFMVLREQFHAGDVIEYRFGLRSGSLPTEGDAAIRGMRKLYYGPLLLAAGVNDDPKLPATIHITPEANHRFRVDGTDVALGTVYHLLDPQVAEKPRYAVRILFPIVQ